MTSPGPANYTPKKWGRPRGFQAPSRAHAPIAASGDSRDAEISGHSDKARQVELARLHDFPVAQIAAQYLPHRLDGAFVRGAVGDGRPARHLVELVRFDRAPAQAHVADAHDDFLAGAGG